MGRNDFLSQIIKSLSAEQTKNVLAALSIEELAKKNVYKTDKLCQCLVDFKNEIGGNFELKSCTPDRAILWGCECPFGGKVLNRPHMCNLTKDFFESASQKYCPGSRVELNQTIAQGYEKCIITISFK